jgi:pyruvate kinase
MATHLESLTAVKTKIIATIGPASEPTAMLTRLAESGADVFRLNFAHGEWDWHSSVIQRVRKDVSPSLGRPIAVLQDLGGPKLRLGEIPGGSMMCHLGDTVRIVKVPSGQADELTCSYPGLVDDLREGDSVLLADGTVALQVISKSKDQVETKVTLPGMVASRQGIASPSAKLQLESLTEKDIHDLDWAAQHEVDFVGMSFVRHPDDIVRLRKELAQRGCNAHIVAKVEKAEALNALDDIIRLTDVVMIARGDLGVEIDVARVPMIQKQIIKRCKVLGVPVITATQMLESMRMSNRPTRAEASDVANAILDGTDVIMLSAETASGQFPVEAVETMNRIALETERSMTAPSPFCDTNEGSLPEVIQATVHAAGLLAEQAHAALVIVTTKNGKGAIALSKQRYRTATLGLSDNLVTVRRMAMYWGVVPVHYPDPIDNMDATKKVTAWAKQEGLVKPGERIVYLLGASWSDKNHTALLVEKVS